MSELWQLSASELREKIDRAAGYGAFDNVGVQVAFFGGGGGRGIVVDEPSCRCTPSVTFFAYSVR